MGEQQHPLPGRSAALAVVAAFQSELRSPVWGACENGGLYHLKVSFWWNSAEGAKAVPNINARLTSGRAWPTPLGFQVYLFVGTTSGLWRGASALNQAGQPLLPVANTAAWLAQGRLGGTVQRDGQQHNAQATPTVWAIEPANAAQDHLAEAARRSRRSPPSTATASASG
jgi:hypothetical protein